MPTPLPKPAVPPLQKPAVPVANQGTPVQSAAQQPVGSAPRPAQTQPTQVRPTPQQTPTTRPQTIQVTPPPAAPATPARPTAPPVAPAQAPQAGSAPTQLRGSVPTPAPTVQQQPNPAVVPQQNMPQQAAPQRQVQQQPVRIQQPPQTLTALSSMASNRLPSGAGATVQTPDPKQTASAGGGDKAPPAQKTPLSATAQAPKAPQFVQPKKSPLRFLPVIGGVVILLLLIGFVAMRFLGGSGTTSVSNSSTGGSGNSGGTSGAATTGGTAGQQAQQPTGQKVTIEYWGLWEPTETMESVISDYETANPGVTIKYSKQSHKDYRTRLQSALNSENGPDIFRYHATWLPMMRQNLASLPASVMSASEFQNTFYPVAVNQLQSNGQIVGIPLMYDGLVLFYNTDIFKTAVLEAPKSWSDIRLAAEKLTIREDNKIKRAGIALGNSTNVEHFSDILGLLMLQNGADLTKPESPQVRDALLFYSNFVKMENVWDSTLPSSTVAFARGDVAMMFAPSWRAHEIKAMNPDLQFATAPVPQLTDSNRITWATYWAEGVSAKSEQKDASWKFLKYLSSKEVQQKLYAAQAQTRSFGELYSRKDLAETLAKDPVLSAFVQDAPYARGWYLSSYTHDAGVNDQLIQYYADAVTALLQGKQIDEVQETLSQGVPQVLRQYNIQSSTTTN